ncbi:uncharacterized protein LOC132194711 [Neocloeon triangulifer]|uniref:uncharacterized protein LOC132194711 n=1 Tax=Neocloeon triangulifer TaxID=2078957 RepID=UPI00286F0F6A|nr:uncharacterized protein LOC132194711 [Neocloeon triangulifer]
MTDRDLKLILKGLLNDRTDDILKLDLLYQLESLEIDVTGLNAALNVLRALQNNEAFLNDPLRLIRSQSIHTATALLLNCHAKFGPELVKAAMANHIDLLLSFCNGSDANLKAVAATSLSEIQLCFKDLLGPCVAVIDTLAAFEASAAHQPLLQLLSLLATEEQTAAFLIAQLPLLSTPAAVFLAARLASLATPFLIRPFLQQILVTFDLSSLCAAVRLSHFLDDFGRVRLLNHLLGLSKDPGLAAAVRLVLLDMAVYFSNRSNLPISSPSFTPADGAHSKLKKAAIMFAEPSSQSEIAALESIVEDAASTKNKSVNAKVLYLASRNEQLIDVCKKVAVDLTLKDLSFAPHFLQLVQTVPELEPSNLMSSLVSTEPPHPKHLSHFIMLLKQAVASRSAAVARPKESLSLAARLVNSSSEGLSPNTAHRLLSVCHQIIKVFDPADFNTEMTALLSAVAAKCPEEDVAARVVSFESLLGCLTDSKVREVLRSQKKGLVAGLFHRPQAVKVMELPAMTLQVCKAPVHVPEEKKSERVIQGTDVLTEYWPLIQSSKQRQIKINILVTPEQNEPLNAIAVFFEPLLPFGQMEPLLIGRVSSKTKAVGAYTPERPYPVILAARAEFQMSGRSYCCPLQDLTIGLASLFQPMPGGSRKQVAKAMWEHMKEWPEASVVLPEEAAKAKLKELKPFLVNPGGNLVTTFLAPSSHLLFKFGNMDSAVVKIDIKTDDVILLAHANDFLLKSK